MKTVDILPAGVPALPLLLASGFAMVACLVLALAGERAQRTLFRRPTPPLRRRLLRAAALACLTGSWVGGGLAVAGEPLASLLRRAPAPPLILLGEVHDNATQHALRLQAFEALLQSGARTALLLEQFDRERQADIDQVRRRAGIDADAVVTAAAPEGSRWQWAFYKPFITLALAHDLPIVAANVSRVDARKVIAEGLRALAFDDRVPADIAAAQAELIVASHCGMVDAARGLHMATAQIARDQFMARLVERHADRGVVLLAGNGHVRRDIGVPRWLKPEIAGRVKAIGLLEEGDSAQAVYDHAFTTARQPRPDPCAAMRRTTGRSA
jgi:uncharacterized iron-regulated protein